MQTGSVAGALTWRKPLPGCRDMLYCSAMKPDTLLVTAGRDPEAQAGAVNPPVYRASTIVFPTLDALEESYRRRFDPIPYYGRYGTPTTFAFEDAVAKAEGGFRAIAFSSGKAAIAAVLTAFVKTGDHVLIADSVYAPTRVFASFMLARYGVAVEFYDPLIGAAIAGLMRPETKLVYCESPGSLTFEVQDIAAIAASAHDRGVVVALDNSWASPLFFKPFAHGVDVSIQAATKYLGGHSDAMLGVVTTNQAAYGQLRAVAAELGACPGSEEVYLGQRGLRTLSVRLKRHMETGIQLAVWLKRRPEVARVMHPALPDDPGHGLWARDFLGASGLFGVALQPTPRPALAAMVDHLELFHMGFSWGGFESLILPVDPGRVRSATRWQGTGPVLRLHAGLEDPDDLIADLDKGFARLNAAR